ncbi:uncharacterized protein M421DRAFT_126690 [Didymella exigua CBS 183.55]|uniref:Uncharacterized protein n=1 Tax=Didymella exigua CBS 183.55 TaxID=1150837 RepID=A0A6A5RMQ2_9PLEO|nr:uncharacterized protein M421DRAFT_126690 [Didymella exigua CBS 183.55]KAF1929691.1 hypothetical protein M421DRAFT_126690 [Didymella exigua CBS 183.55]
MEDGAIDIRSALLSYVFSVATAVACGVSFPFRRRVPILRPLPAEFEYIQACRQHNSVQTNKHQLSYLDRERRYNARVMPKTWELCSDRILHRISTDS